MPNRTITLELTQEQAQTLADVIYHCIGGPTEGPRGHMDNIAVQLSIQGVSRSAHELFESKTKFYTREVRVSKDGDYIEHYTKDKAPTIYLGEHPR